MSVPPVDPSAAPARGAVDALYGALYYRLLIPYAPMTDAYIDRLVSTVLGGMENPGRSEKTD